MTFLVASLQQLDFDSQTFASTSDVNASATTITRLDAANVDESCPNAQALAKGSLSAARDAKVHLAVASSASRVISSESGTTAAMAACGCTNTDFSLGT